jgi:hypothetical protein
LTRKWFCIFIIIVAPVFGQRVELVRAAEHVSFVDANGRQIRELSGDVHVRQDTLDLFCQRARIEEQQRRIILIDKVQLRTPGRRLFCRKAIYERAQKTIELIDSVRVEEPGRNLFTHRAFVYLENDSLVSPGYVVVRQKDDNAMISANSGWGLLKKEQFNFIGDAHFSRPAEDTTNINAEMIRVFGRDYFRASGSVVLQRGDLSALCDSTSYSLASGRVNLYGDPRAYWQLNEMVGDTMRIFLDRQSNQPDSLHIRGRAEIFAPLDSLKSRENYLAGQAITGFFVANELRQLSAVDNAISRYYLDSGNARQSGANLASADTIKLFLSNQEVDSVHIAGGIEGRYLPR